VVIRNLLPVLGEGIWGGVGGVSRSLFDDLYECKPKGPWKIRKGAMKRSTVICICSLEERKRGNIVGSI
jgi:hypothetical protein